MNILTLFGLVLLSISVNAQKLTIEKDPRIDTLLAVKKEINKKEAKSKAYRIQLYFGSRQGAEKKCAEFRESFSKMHCEIVFETPNYKVQVGGFYSRMAAERSLLIIKKTFSNAFLLHSR